MPRKPITTYAEDTMPHNQGRKYKKKNYRTNYEINKVYEWKIQADEPWKEFSTGRKTWRLAYIQRRETESLIKKDIRWTMTGTI